MTSVLSCSDGGSSRSSMPTTVDATLHAMRRELTCIVCQDLFKEPVLSPCSHTFCRDCIGNWVRAKSRCPLCNTHITMRALNPDTSVLRLVEAFVAIGVAYEHDYGHVMMSQEAVLHTTTGGEWHNNPRDNLSQLFPYPEKPSSNSGTGCSPSAMPPPTTLRAAAAPSPISSPSSSSTSSSSSASSSSSSAVSTPTAGTTSKLTYDELARLTGLNSTSPVRAPPSPLHQADVMLPQFSESSATPRSNPPGAARDEGESGDDIADEEDEDDTMVSNTPQADADATQQLAVSATPERPNPSQAHRRRLVDVLESDEEAEDTTTPRANKDNRALQPLHANDANVSPVPAASSKKTKAKGSATSAKRRKVAAATQQQHQLPHVSTSESEDEIVAMSIGDDNSTMEVEAVIAETPLKRPAAAMASEEDDVVDDTLNGTPFATPSTKLVHSASGSSEVDLPPVPWTFIKTAIPDTPVVPGPTPPQQQQQQQTPRDAPQQTPAVNAVGASLVLSQSTPVAPPQHLQQQQQQQSSVLAESPLNLFAAERHAFSLVQSSSAIAPPPLPLAPPVFDDDLTLDANFVVQPFFENKKSSTASEEDNEDELMLVDKGKPQTIPEEEDEEEEEEEEDEEDEATTAAKNMTSTQDVYQRLQQIQRDLAAYSGSKSDEEADETTDSAPAPAAATAQSVVEPADAFASPKKYASASSINMSAPLSMPSSLIELSTVAACSPDKFVFVSTGTGKKERKLVDQLVKLFGSTKSDTVTEGTTHVITNADDDLCAQSPTLKLLQGILMGKFAVTMGWVAQCLDEGKWVPEEPYEIRGCLKGPTMGPRKARLELSKRNALPLMTDLLFVVTGMVWQGGLSTDDILGLIRLGGGKVVSTVPQDRTTHYVHIVGDDQDLAATIVRKTHHEVRDFFWLMDGISAYDLGPLPTNHVDVTSLNDEVQDSNEDDDGLPPPPFLSSTRR